MEVARHWRLNAQRYRLEGSMCPVCGQLFFPPRPICPDCHRQAAPSAGGGLSAIPASIGLADIRAHLSRQFAERLDG